MNRCEQLLQVFTAHWGQLTPVLQTVSPVMSVHEVITAQPAVKPAGRAHRDSISTQHAARSTPPVRFATLVIIALVWHS